MKSNFKAKPGGFGAKKKPEELIKYKSETPNIESDSEDEINYIGKEFGKAKQKEVDHFHSQTDLNYYTCIFFKNEEQKKQFYEVAKILDLVDESGRFVKGEDFCDRLNIKIDKVSIKKMGKFAGSKRFSHDEFFG